MPAPVRKGNDHSFRTAREARQDVRLGQALARRVSDSRYPAQRFAWLKPAFTAIRRATEMLPPHPHLPAAASGDAEAVGARGAAATARESTVAAWQSTFSGISLSGDQDVTSPLWRARAPISVPTNSTASEELARESSRAGRTQNLSWIRRRFDNVVDCSLDCILDARLPDLPVASFLMFD